MMLLVLPYKNSSNLPKYRREAHKIVKKLINYEFTYLILLSHHIIYCHKTSPKSPENLGSSANDCIQMQSISI
jgi:hypothetical protein